VNRDRPRVYLAGPDVFLPDPVGAGARKKRLCATYGFEGVFPLDATLDLQGLSSREAAMRISRANEELIRGCQLVIAQMTPFRGPSADAGTAYEMGFARGLGLAVFAYTNVVEDFAARTESWARPTRRRADGSVEDAMGMQIEPFGVEDNLMLVGAVAASGGEIERRETTNDERFSDVGGFEKCLVAARAHFDSARPRV
jgi:nucleoside 2-deoxyribosyltransferase